MIHETQSQFLRLALLASFAAPSTNEPPEEPANKTAQHESHSRSVREFEGGVPTDEVSHGNYDCSEDSKRQSGAECHQTEKSFPMFGVFGHQMNFRRE